MRAWEETSRTCTRCTSTVVNSVKEWGLRRTGRCVRASTRGFRFCGALQRTLSYRPSLSPLFSRVDTCTASLLLNRMRPPLEVCRAESIPFALIIIAIITSIALKNLVNVRVARESVFRV